MKLRTVENEREERTKHGRKLTAVSSLYKREKEREGFVFVVCREKRKKKKKIKKKGKKRKERK